MITWFLDKEGDMPELFSNTCYDIKWLINLIWFKKLIKVVYLLRLFNLTLIFSSPCCPLKRAWEKCLSCTYPTLLYDLITPRYFLLSPRDGREPLLMFVKDRVDLLEYHATYIVYLLLLPHCTCFMVYAIKIFHFSIL